MELAALVPHPSANALNAFLRLADQPPVFPTRGIGSRFPHQARSRGRILLSDRGSLLSFSWGCAGYAQRRTRTPVPDTSASRALALRVPHLEVEDSPPRGRVTCPHREMCICDATAMAAMRSRDLHRGAHIPSSLVAVSGRDAAEQSEATRAPIGMCPAGARRSRLLGALGFLQPVNPTSHNRAGS